MRKERVGEREKGREMRFCDVQRSRSPRGSPASAPGGRRSFQSVCLAVAVAVTVALACRSRRGAASAGTGGATIPQTSLLLCWRPLSKTSKNNGKSLIGAVSFPNMEAIQASTGPLTT